MILKDISNQPPFSTLIQDTWFHNGRPLFLSLIRHYTENGFFIRYFKYDSFLSSEKSSMEHFNLSLQEFIVDGSRNESMTSIEKDWTSESHRDSVIIAIDSLTPLLLNWGISHVANTLRNALKTKRLSVISLIHGDAHDEETLKALNCIFSCHLTLRKAHGENLSSGIWRKASGKIIDSDEYYSITKTWELKDVRQVTETKNCVVPDSVPKSVIPKSTFKLDLNAKEEEARSQVVLPYIRKQTETAVDVTTKGQIIYEAETTDWDDEDPDDDLEI